MVLIKPGSGEALGWYNRSEEQLEDADGAGWKRWLRNLQVLDTLTPVVEIQERIEPLVAEWERLARHTKASPFLWPGWIGACWNVFGAGRLQIFAVYENGHLTGVLPLRRFRGVLSPITISETFGFLAANETAAEQLSYALFSQKARCVDLYPLPPTNVGVSPARATAKAAGYRVVAESIQAAPYVAINETTWNEYEGGLRRKFRSELRRRRRRLEGEGRLTLEVCDGTERLDELLEEGFRVEGSGWKGVYGTNINLHPGLRRFYTEVGRWAAQRGWLRLAFLRLDGQALAFDYCLEYNKVHYLLKTGYDPTYAKFAPGMILRYLMLSRAFSEGLAIYDFCGPDFAWKREWTDTLQERLFLRMFAPTALGSLDRAVTTYVSPALKRAKKRAKRSALGGLLKRGRGLARRRLSGRLGK